ncbi:MAG: TRAP transporter fused permease subunit [Chloroflexi bacterium]|nr:TRAP transporter fused permease subunit [Chloroflexota bacterium]
MEWARDSREVQVIPQSGAELALHEEAGVGGSLVPEHMVKRLGQAKWVVFAATWIALTVTVLYVFRTSIIVDNIIETAFMAFLLGMFLPLVFLMFPVSNKRQQNRIPWYDWVLAGLSLVGPAFIFVNAVPLVVSVWQLRPPPFAFAVGILTLCLLLEASRRAIGLSYTVIVGVVLVYPLFASNMPEVLLAKSYSIERIVGFQFLSTAGIFGIPMGIFGTALMGFMVFGTVMDATGASKFLLDVAQGLLGKARGGPALVSILASSFMASLSGSSIANVVTVGTVTIPAMKKAGYKPTMAAAIEACASNGGQLMPPVMGATAFVMAGLLRIPYASVAIAALLPMIVYYAGLFANVYLYAQRHGLPALQASEIPSLKTTLKNGWYYLSAVAVLVYLMFWIKVETWAPYYAILFLVLCSFIRRETRPNMRTLHDFTLATGHAMAFLAPVMATAGIVMGSLSLTGTAHSIAGELATLAGGNLYLLAAVGAIAALILGTGMQSTPVYIFTALVFAPTLEGQGIYPVAAHLFFLYWGMIGLVTPPVCTTSFVAAVIAGSPPMRTGFKSCAISVFMYVLPFAFLLNPALVAHGTLTAIVGSVLAATVGAVLIAVAMEGYMLRIGVLGIVPRLATFVLGFSLAFVGVLF